MTYSRCDHCPVLHPHIPDDEATRVHSKRNARYFDDLVTAWMRDHGAEGTSNESHGHRDANPDVLPCLLSARRVFGIEWIRFVCHAASQSCSRRFER